MVEIVARAMIEAGYGPDLYKRLARAALTAITREHWIAPREPTPEMMNCTQQVTALNGRMMLICGEDILPIYRAMRDAYEKGKKDD